MLISRLWLRPLRYLGVLLVLLTLLPWACTRKTVSFNSTPEPPVAVVVSDTLTRTADSLKGKPSLSTERKVVMTKEQERAAKEKEKEAQRKPKKKKKLFLGEKIKRGFVKSGASGRNQIIEIFYYLKYFQQPNPYAPARYYFNPKKRKLFKATAELDPATDKVLHGPYKKMQNNKVLETGYYALGTKHLRWERFDKNGILLSKTHYEMGFPRDANISYYDPERKMPKEVVPYVNGKLEGDYAKFTIEGQREWSGQFENGHKVGEWTNYWGFRNRKRYVYQYPESGYDPEVEEPVLVKEYNRNAILIYDKETNLDKRGLTEEQQAPKGRVVPRAPAKVAPKKARP
jgi:antitoxin component YwqK of YwqJK toxin-antitoxin module